jgi:hypothetical protein
LNKLFGIVFAVLGTIGLTTVPALTVSNCNGTITTTWSSTCTYTTDVFTTNRCSLAVPCSAGECYEDHVDRAYCQFNPLDSCRKCTHTAVLATRYHKACNSSCGCTSYTNSTEIVSLTSDRCDDGGTS